MKSRVILSEAWDPYFNTAAEYELMKSQSQGVAMFLWQNDDSVFIGRNQNIYDECNISFLKEEGISPVRRLSGGGAVFQDRGNLNFSFMCPAGEADMEKMKTTVQAAITGLGLECEFSGRNDLLCGTRKISGHAYYEEDGSFLYHGTLLYNVDMAKLERSLCPSAEKLVSKGVASVKSRVANLKELLPCLTMEKLKNQLTESFWESYGRGAEPEKINAVNYSADEKLVKKLKSREWIYGQAPDWSIKLEKRLSFGLVSAEADIKDGRIEAVRFYTDSLLSVDFSQCEKELAGRWFDENEIFDIVEGNML